MTGESKSTYVFGGSNMSDMMGVVSFRKFGQRAELTQEQARDLALGGSVIAPMEKVDSPGFAEAVRKHSAFGSHEKAGPGFVEQQKAVIAAYYEFRDSLLEPAIEKAGEV